MATDRMLETQLYYILDENKIVIPATYRDWLKFHNQSNLNQIKKNNILPYHISTNFIGVDHGFPFLLENEQNYSPILFITTITKGPDQLEIYKDKYNRWEEAEKGHEKALEWLKNVHLINI